MISGAPSQLNISYISSWSGGAPNAQAVAVALIPLVQSGSVAGSAQTQQPADYTLTLKNAFLNGGVWIVANGVPTFVPWNAILSVTAT